MFPLVLTCEMLREDVGGLRLRVAICKLDLRGPYSFMQPRNARSMRALDMPERRGLSSPSNSRSRGIVLVDFNLQGPLLGVLLA